VTVDGLGSLLFFRYRRHFGPAGVPEVGDLLGFGSGQLDDANQRIFIEFKVCT
jgi:hypothetical protein